MSFTHEFKTQRSHLAPLFAAAEKADREFNAGWEDGLARLGFQRYKQTEQYSQTLDCFKRSVQMVDQIVMTALEEAKAGKYTHLAALFAYVALPGRYFRSGYLRARIWRFLKQAPLDDEQAQLLRGIVPQQIADAGPEFKEIVRAAARINSAGLREAVKHFLLQPHKQYVLDRGRRLLNVLEDDYEAK